MTIGQKIKQRRTELMWSQRELAAKMGYNNNSTVARIESGSVDIPHSRVIQFADVLGVSVGYLMGSDAHPEELGALAADVLLNPDLLRLVQLYTELEEADKGMVMMLVENLHQKTKKADT